MGNNILIKTFYGYQNLEEYGGKFVKKISNLKKKDELS